MFDPYIYLMNVFILVSHNVGKKNILVKSNAAIQAILKIYIEASVI